LGGSQNYVVLPTFQTFIDSLRRYVNETPNRVPMSDWYETPDAKQVGFQARSDFDLCAHHLLFF